MARHTLTETQRKNAFDGLQALLKKSSWTQQRMADALGVTQQAMSPVFKGKISQKVAVFVAEQLGVTFKELADERKFEPTDQDLLRRARRVGSLAEWGPALEIAKHERFPGHLPDWCWEEAGEFLVTQLPQELTPEYVHDLAQAMLDQIPATMRRAMSAIDAKKTLAKMKRGTPEEILATFRDPADNSHRKTAPPK